MTSHKKLFNRCSITLLLSFFISSTIDSDFDTKESSLYISQSINEPVHNAQNIAEDALSTTASSNNDTSPQTESCQEPVCITIFVHGIISVKPHLSFGNVIRLMRDKIANSSYARTVEIIRKNPFFYQHHPMQGLGLKEIDMNCIEKGTASTAFARSFDSISNYIKPSPIKNFYYTFGWSGLLSPRMRYLEAKIFYQSIVKLIEEFRARGMTPKIRVVGYSHGGNVALRLASVHDNKKHNNPLMSIDELILIGVPILPDTHFLVSNSTFKRIYHFYSFGDRIQNLDCFALNRFFSDRVFYGKSDRKLPDKLIQIQLKIKRPMAYSYKKYTESKNLRNSRLRNADPGHSEFWSFGWTHANYRENFPFYPLPMTIFTPFIIQTLDSINITSGSVVVEIHPHQENFFIVDTSNTITMPFITSSYLNDLKKYAEQFRPDNYSAKEYNARIQEAIVAGKKESRKERTEQKSPRKRRLKKQSLK